ncbi:MAG: hypothetical protein KKA54_08080 [Proteobacteria bacterium]|nr:hypothetical protein [Pseudomonadota bacterium]
MKAITSTFLITLIVTSSAFAGGDYWKYKIMAFDEAKGNATITLQAIDKKDTFSNCNEIEIFSKYEHVPWFSWLPFVHTNHPTPKENHQAIDFIKLHYKNDQNIYFGYMGYGLVPTENACEFKSKGLRIEKINNLEIVTSYHNET